MSPELVAGFLATSATWEVQLSYIYVCVVFCNFWFFVNIFWPLVEYSVYQTSRCETDTSTIDLVEVGARAQCSFTQRHILGPRAMDQVLVVLYGLTYLRTPDSPSHESAQWREHP